MTDPVNLNRFRKERQRADKKARADENAALHRLSKADKSTAKNETARQAQRVEAHRRDHDQAPKKPE